MPPVGRRKAPSGIEGLDVEQHPRGWVTPVHDVADFRTAARAGEQLVLAGKKGIAHWEGGMRNRGGAPLCGELRQLVCVQGRS